MDLAIVENFFGMCYNRFMIDIKRIWQDACQKIVGIEGVNAISYSVWIASLTPLCVKDNTLILLAPSVNNKHVVNRSYKSAIQSALESIGSIFTDVRIIVDEEKDFYYKEIEEYSDNTVNYNEKESQFISRYTFDNFVVGESNKLAFHAAQSVAKSPGVAENTYLSFNPLFLYGGVGLGKTHLLHSIGNYVNEHMPHLKVLYTPTEKLTNDYVEAISNNRNEKGVFNLHAFREKYRTVDMLMLDDVQFLQKRTGLQEVVFHIFNDLYQNGKQIVLTSDRPPSEIATLEDRLRSRFEGGLIADIGAPNLEMRIAIIRKKMILEKIAVNDDVVYYLAERIDSNIRELEGSLAKVIFYAKLKGLPYPDIDTAKEALKNTVQKKHGVDSSDIIQATCSYFNISQSDIISKKRTKDIAEARMIAIYIITEMLSLPLVTIGQMFGGRDYSTIIHSRDKIASLLKDDPDTIRAIKDIKSMLN